MEAKLYINQNQNQNLSKNQRLKHQSFWKEPTPKVLLTS